MKNCERLHLELTLALRPVYRATLPEQGDGEAHGEADGCLKCRMRLFQHT